MKRRWNRIPKTEEVVCFEHVRIDDVSPLPKEEKMYRICHPHVPRVPRIRPAAFPRMPEGAFGRALCGMPTPVTCAHKIGLLY